jgi:transcription-repair coupling factor (superfamily II helicase)
LVGYQLYCELLAEAVHRLKGERVEKAPSVSLELGISAAIPKSYIPQDKARMEAYRKIAAARTSDEIPQIEGEFTDVYGPAPEEAKLLLELAHLRIKAALHNIKSIIASPPNLVFSFGEPFDKKIESLLSKTSGTVRVIDPKTIYLKLGRNYFEPNTLLTFLRRLFRPQE